MANVGTGVCKGTKRQRLGGEVNRTFLQCHLKIKNGVGCTLAL